MIELAERLLTEHSSGIALIGSFWSVEFTKANVTRSYAVCRFLEG